MVAYANLRAEMARKNITIKDIENILDVNRDTVRRKLSRRSPIYLDEAFKIQKTFFPDKDLKTLFNLCDDNSAS